MLSSSPDSEPVNGKRSKTKAKFSSLKGKANQYMKSVATKNANNSYGRNISRLISAGSMAATPGPPGSNLITPLPPLPSEDEVLTVYPSYSRQTESGTYEVDVRGWLYLKGEPTRKSRLIHATARRIAGIKSTKFRSSTQLPVDDHATDSSDQESLSDNSDEEDEDLKDLKGEYSLRNKSRKRSPSESSMSDAQAECHRETLKARLEPFLTRPVTGRTVKITFSGLLDSSGQSMKIFEAETNSSGRFKTRVTLENKPSTLSVEAHELLVCFEEVINIEPYGVSVISDIDDTIKNSGVIGNKRQLFRNVFVYDYERIAIEGVQPWYQALDDLGVKFHYLSNSPWQLYPTVSSYLLSAKFPRGSMHLKDYNGALNGLFEPASDRKKKSLHQILQDFPHRKFVLIGDSGEGDLEAYIDVARNFPTQVLALFIRDVTLPPEAIDTEYSAFRRNMIPRPDEIDMYDSSIKTPSLRKKKASKRRDSSSTRSIDRASITSLLPISKSDTTESHHHTYPVTSNLTHAIPSNLQSSSSSLASAYQAQFSVDSSTTSADTFIEYSCSVQPTASINSDHPPPPKPPKILGTGNSLDTSYWQMNLHKLETPAIVLQPSTPHPKNEVNELSSYPLPNVGLTTPELGLSPVSSNVSSSSEKSLVSLSDEAELTELSGKKVEVWKSRVMSARCDLPSDTRLRIWRVGSDSSEECLEVVKREMERMHKIVIAAEAG